MGRVGELAELELAVREATSGRPTLVLLGGDSGLGKTRLVAELVRRLTTGQGPGSPLSPTGPGSLPSPPHPGAPAPLDPDAPAPPDPDAPAPLVLRGDGVQQSDGELPYAPLLSALRPLVRARHPVLEALSPGTRAQLATILPGLDDDPRIPEERVDPSGQLRLFEAILALIDALADTAPVLLIIEDMHWADRSTRAFVTFLARSLRTERVMLALTYRTDELHRRHPLRPLLAELERLERARRIELEPFDRDELRQALADILGSAPADQLLERLFARSEGNPLYTEELLAAGLDGRGAPPQSLRDVFLVRIERLSADAQRVARAVAIGRALDEAALAAATGSDRDSLQAALRDAVAEQVLVPGADGRFCFRHALLREALYDDLLPGERGELHMALARHLEAAGSPAGDDEELERTASIASHYAAAGDQPAALRTTIEAATAARHVQAWGEAADLLQRALELWPRVAGAEAIAGMDHVELLGRAAVALSIIDERSRADALLTHALDELDPERDPARHAALLGRRARILWSLNRGEEAVALAERALAMVPDDDPRGDRPLLLAWLARSRFLRGRLRQSATDAEAALAAAIDAGDTTAETEVLNTLGMAQVSLQQTDAGLASLRSAVELARANGDIDSLATAYSNLADMLGIAGRPAEALRTARDGLAATPRNYRRNHDWLTLTLSELAFDAGDWGLARECLSPPPSRMTGTLYIFRQGREAELALGVGDEDSAQACLEAAAGRVEMSSEPQWIGLHGSLCADLHMRRGDLDAARAAVQHALDRLELCTDDVMRIARVSVNGVQVEADRAQRARDLGDGAARRDALTRARLHIERLAAAAQEGGPLERARLAHGRAEMARARGKAAHREWAPGGAGLGGADAALPGDDRTLASGREPGRRRRPRSREHGGRRWASVRARAGLAMAGAGAASARRARPPVARRSPGGVARGPGGGPPAGPVRADRARASGAGAAGPGRDQPPDRRGAVHGREDRQRARLADPGQARRAGAHRGGGGGPPPAPGLSASRRPPVRAPGSCPTTRWRRFPSMRTPAEWEPHERTLMGWPCRTELWGETIDHARSDYATVANAVGAFEPVTMLANPGADAAAARAACGEAVEIVELALDDSWLRDCGPIYTYADDGFRLAVHFRFNAWGERFAGWDDDAAVGSAIARRLGDPVAEADLVLEGGSILTDGRGTLLTTEQCLLNRNRNPDRSRDEIEDALRAHLGVSEIVWLGQGLVEDRDTDGHVDLIAAFTAPGHVLLQTVSADNPNHDHCVENRDRLRAAGIEVTELPLLPYAEVAGETIAASYLNFYIANGGVIVPVAGADTDEAALAIIAAAYPGREVVPVPGLVIAYGGGGPHCITQQVPVRRG